MTLIRLLPMQYENLIYHPWEGGKPAGCVWLTRSAACLMMNVAKLGIRARSVCFNFDEHGSVDGAFNAALSMRLAVSNDLGETRNRYRLVQRGIPWKQWYEMDIGRGMTMLFDVDDLPDAQMVYWFPQRNKRHWSAVGKVKESDGERQTIGFHNLITGWGFVDHGDLDSLNNRRYNLAPSAHKPNSRGHRRFSTNTSGIVGVSFLESRESWIAQWYDNDGKNRNKWFSIRTRMPDGTERGYERAKTMAIAARRDAEAALGIEIRVPLKRPRGPEDVTVDPKAKRPRL